MLEFYNIIVSIIIFSAMMFFLCHFSENGIYVSISTSFRTECEPIILNLNLFVLKLE